MQKIKVRKKVQMYFIVKTGLKKNNGSVFLFIGLGPSIKLMDEKIKRCKKYVCVNCRQIKRNTQISYTVYYRLVNFITISLNKTIGFYSETN